MLFGAEGYLFTEVWCEVPEARQYRVKDSWAWHRNFERFRDRVQAEFEEFERWLRSKRLIEKEQFLGAYYEKRDGRDDEGLVVS